MKLYFIFLSALVFFGSSCKVAKTTQIYLVRHAERTNPPQDDLIPSGVTRANELSRVLFQAGIDSIFTTDLNRTKKTVQPLARAKRLPLILYSENDLLIDRILKNNKGKTVLVAAHSNTIAEFITKCGCTPPFVNIPSRQFDNLFLLILQKEKINNSTSSSCKLLWMKYGAVTN